MSFFKVYTGGGGQLFVFFMFILKLKGEGIGSKGVRVNGSQIFHHGQAGIFLLVMDKINILWPDFA